MNAPTVATWQARGEHKMTAQEKRLDPVRGIKALAFFGKLGLVCAVAGVFLGSETPAQSLGR
ncbi:hypothetical protein [uncultured Thiodictyon sp.]|uniref:hypothetical protein n=1 Tax=uncultured Thiodictyon sp. TaxID=1846217 RepID=UPI002600D8F2|nr:hypothetical protein [uncultured Thiodictyon sp.]